MKIFCIDSTSYIPRIAIVEDGEKFYEKRWVASTEKWNNMISGDASYIIDDFFDLIRLMKKETELDISDCDYICYSWFSGFQSTMNLGKIFAKSLGIQYGLEVICVDHITAHYFSQFTQERNNKKTIAQDFPILFFSASGSHNSLALLKNFTELTIFHDKTYFDVNEQKYLGLGSIYFRACKVCNILNSNEWGEHISGKLEKLDWKYDQGLVEKFLVVWQAWGIFDMNFHNLLFYLEENIESYEWIYEYDVVFCSFEEAIFQLIETKLKNILQITPCRQISIVWGISQNNKFFSRIEKVFSEFGCVVTRPDNDFRFDNAAMLGTLAYYMKKYDIEYPVSKVVT